MAGVHQLLLQTLHRLMQAKGRTPGTPVNISQQTLVTICQAAKEQVMKEPVLLELEPPLHIVGDIHAQFYDLLRIFDLVGHPPGCKYVFLGDYVDRGRQNVEVIALLLIYKILYPDKVFILRGNHECAEVNEVNGFKAECVFRYSARLWTVFNEMFDTLPLAASIGGKIFAAHAGISRDITSLAFFKGIKRPLQNVEGAASDLIWSDPDALVQEWAPNPRGRSVLFGQRQAHEWLDRLGFDIVVRAHQMVPGGIAFPFGPNGRVVTLFSAPCGVIGSESDGAVMSVNEAFACSFVKVKPMERRQPVRKSLSPVDEIIAACRASTRLGSRKW